MEFIELHIQKGGVNPKTFDWWNVTESFDLDPPKFNEEEMKITLKFLLDQDEYVTVCLMSHKWERYYENRRVGTGRKMEMLVVSAGSQFTPFIGTTIINNNRRFIQSFLLGAIVLKYDKKTVSHQVSDFYSTLAKHIYLYKFSATFFGQIAERLQVPRDKIGKFILDCCEVEFTKWDWANDLKEHVEARDDKLFDEVANWQETVKSIKGNRCSFGNYNIDIFN